MTTLHGRPTGDRELEELGPWFHNLHLPDGRQTAPDHPLGDFPALLWRHVESSLPSDLRGWSVLDVGCNAGFYSLQMALRGADVLALDVDDGYLRQARWASERFGVAEAIRFQRRSVYRIGELHERFDLVLFLGVLYHLRYPLLALDLVRERTARLLLFQSLSLPGEEVLDTPADVPIDGLAALLHAGWPKAVFVEHQVAGDPTNWWIPDRAGLEAMLRSSGFAELRRLHTNTWICAPDANEAPAAAASRVDEMEAATGAIII